MKCEVYHKRTGLGIHARVRIADFREALRYREYREVSWVTVRDLVPVKRGRDTDGGFRARGMHAGRSDEPKQKTCAPFSYKSYAEFVTETSRKR